jgi:hypothetical protein
VNLALLIIVGLLGMFNRSLGWAETMPNAHAFLRALWNPLVPVHIPASFPKVVKADALPAGARK